MERQYHRSPVFQARKEALDDVALSFHSGSGSSSEWPLRPSLVVTRRAPRRRCAQEACYRPSRRRAIGEAARRVGLRAGDRVRTGHAHSYELRIVPANSLDLEVIADLGSALGLFVFDEDAVDVGDFVGGERKLHETLEDAQLDPFTAARE